MAQFVKLMIAIAIFLTYALQFYVPMEIIWNAVKAKNRTLKDFAEYSIRIALVVSRRKDQVLGGHVLMLFYSLDPDCRRGYYDPQPWPIYIAHRSCVPEHPWLDLPLGNRNCDLLGATRNGQIQLAAMEERVPDLVRSSRLPHWNIRFDPGNIGGSPMRCRPLVS